MESRLNYPKESPRKSRGSENLSREERNVLSYFGMLESQLGFPYFVLPAHKRVEWNLRTERLQKILLGLCRRGFLEKFKVSYKSQPIAYGLTQLAKSALQTSSAMPRA